MTSFLLVVMIQTSDPVVLLLQYAVGDDEHDDNCAFVPVCSSVYVNATQSYQTIV